MPTESKASNERLTTAEWVSRAIETHGDRYDYSEVDYFNSGTKVKVICRDHGEWMISPANHSKGKGCPSCSGNRKQTLDGFIKRGFA